MAFSRKKMNRLFSLLFLLFTSYSDCISPLRSSELNFSELPFYIKDPDSYTMYLVDSSRITLDRTPPPSVPKDYMPYFRANLFEENEATFSQDPPQSIKKWIKISKSLDNSFLVARLMMPNLSRPEHFLERISASLSTDIANGQPIRENHTPDLGDFSFSGGMVIFPQKEGYATIFTFGNAWRTLLNPYVIVPKWGLRVVASEGFCDPQQIREIAASYFRNPIPSKRKERSAAAEDISRFEIEVASEDIESLRVRPNSSYGMKRIVKGDDYLNFCVTKRDKENPGATFTSLQRVSTYFFNLSMQDSFVIHRNLRHFVDDELMEEKLVRALSEQLLTLMRSKEAIHSLFLHDWIWSFFNKKVLRFGEDKTTQIYDHFSSVKTLQCPIKISTVQGNYSSYEPIGRLLYSLPIEHEDRFYRYDRGMWFYVDASRFEAIKKVMRSFKVSSQDLGLPGYCLDDLMGDRKDYGELRYNRRAVSHLNTRPGHQAYLIDRLNIPLKKGGGHIFEFGDIFLIRDNQYYIIHVKRAGASALSHHQEQLERSASYLGTVLNRKANTSLFLKASIQELLCEYGLKEPKSQKGSFQEALKGRRGKGRALGSLLATPDNESQEKPDQNLLSFKRAVLGILRETDSINFFNQHLKAFCEALDVLFLCVQEGKIDLDKEPNSAKIQIRSFIKRARSAIEGGTALFSNGLLKELKQKKVTFVLAIVDDRAVNQFVDEEIKKEQKDLKKKEAREAILNRFRHKKSRFVEHVKQDKTGSLFKSQDLWGLDRTRMAVQRQGFPFLVVVTNEYKDETWDAFGSTTDSFGVGEETDVDKNKENLLEQTREIPFPKRTHTTTKENCNKIVSHMRLHPGKKYTIEEIAAAKNLEIKKVNTLLKKLYPLKVLQRDKRGNSYQYFLSEDYKTPVNSEYISISETGSSSTKSADASGTNPRIKKEPRTLKDVFRRAPLFNGTFLDPYVAQKIEFHGTPNPIQGLFDQYLTCPTIGDGNCFFHAILTEPGETSQEVSCRASGLREQFYHTIQEDDDYAKRFAPLLYEHYLGLWGSGEREDIPSAIRTLFQENDKYVEAQNTLKELGVDPLPPQISAPERHSTGYITDQISLDDIRAYMQRFCVLDGPSSYVSVRGGTLCPAEALAILGEKKVNIFTCDKDTGQLSLYKAMPTLEQATKNDISKFPIINILHTGDHYVRLFNPSESKLHHDQCLQIMKNSGYEGI